MTRYRSAELFSARVRPQICIEDCVLGCFGCPVASLATVSSASFAQPFCDDLHRTSRTSPPLCTVLPTSSVVLWRDVRLADSVVTRQCTTLLSLSQRNFASVLFFVQTFEGSPVVAPGPSGNTEILPRRWWLLS